MCLAISGLHISLLGMGLYRLLRKRLTEGISKPYCHHLRRSMYYDEIIILSLLCQVLKDPTPDENGCNW